MSFSLLQLAALWLAVATGGLVQGATGFGYALIAAPTLMLIAPHMVPGPVILAGLLLTLMMSLREWREVDLKLVGWIMLGTLPGLWLGAEVLSWISARGLAFLFGSLTLLAVGLSWFAPHFHPSPKLLGPAGVLSGVMSITTSMGGPPVALSLQHLPGPKLRGVLSVVFSFGSAISVLTLWRIGRMGAAEFQLGLMFMPAIGLGFLLSYPIKNRLNHAAVRRAVLLVAACSGMAVILRELL
ncbi:sulfite exporter TauE/SafE family protein [Magnetofaba australis]|uniref:Probable membrane transporter protein n=1 Tax=Magnetofaba australis IT-1 TaxID=1434232 RepID=A0A1Y2K020_9PROT|nr:sulfite exporter TauE/SafE family protein [Magnetofaba australis]OSM01383.1 hypothetical protein MAIT1_01322 [Magnetofaba australis IT-1]